MIFIIFIILSVKKFNLLHFQNNGNDKDTYKTNKIQHQDSKNNFVFYFQYFNVNIKF